MRITRKLIEQLKTLYRLTDWNLRIVRSTKRKSDVLGSVEYVAEHKRGCITLYPRVIQETNRTFVDESEDTTLHHEFAELVMGSYETILPEEVRDSREFEVYKDMLAEHWCRVVMEALRHE